MSGHEPALALGYAAFLAVCAALLARSGAKIAREARPDGGEVPWPQCDAVALRRVMAGTLTVLACFILSVAGIRVLLRLG